MDSDRLPWQPSAGIGYWRPTINSLGYRDREPVWSDHLLAIVGASFVAGGGIEDIDARMSGVLAGRLGKNWTVATITPGLDTHRQFEALSAYPKVPDLIIVSHTPADIVAAAERHRAAPADIGLRMPPGWIRPLINHSSLANFVFWKYFNQNSYSAYWTYIESAYTAPDIFADHLEDLKKFKTYAEKTDARLYYLLWPLLADVWQSGKINTQVSAALSAVGAAVIDLTPRLADRPVADLVANGSDPHPNKQVHAEVGNILFDRLQKDGVSASGP
jgi:hypothetical protein